MKPDYSGFNKGHRVLYGILAWFAAWSVAIAAAWAPDSGLAGRCCFWAITCVGLLMGLVAFFSLIAYKLDRRREARRRVQQYVEISLKRKDTELLAKEAFDWPVDACGCIGLVVLCFFINPLLGACFALEGFNNYLTNWELRHFVVRLQGLQLQDQRDQQELLDAT